MLMVDIRAIREYKRYGSMCVFLRLLCVDRVVRRHGDIDWIGWYAATGIMVGSGCTLQRYHVWIGLHATIMCY